MRTSDEPEPAEVENYPPVYLILQHHGNAKTRCLQIQTLFILWRVLFVSHLIRPIQTIRGLLIPLLATHHRLSCWLSRLPLGNNLVSPLVYTFILILTCSNFPLQWNSKAQQEGQN